MPVSSHRWLFAAACLLFPLANASAVIPYTPVPVIGPPTVGPGVMPADFVYGKEYSHDLDFSVLGPVLDPEQIIAWDGGGGTADAADYSGTRPGWEVDQEIDAIANHRDALYTELRRDEAHLAFTHDDTIAAYGGPFGGLSLVTMPSFGPVSLSNGNVIGGAGEVSVEEAGMFSGFSIQTPWASAPEVNGMPLPVDVDGLEVWGKEPGEVNEPEVPVYGDADKYSLDVDLPSGVSVWNAAGTPYVGWGSIVSAVESLLGPVPGTAFSLRDEHQGRQAINLDALMVNDIIESTDVFNEDFGLPGAEGVLDQNEQPIDPFGVEGNVRGDQIIFSIRQIVDPADPDGYYSTGSELFVLDSLAGASFLEHGGHVWDHGFSLTELAIMGSPDQQFEFGVIDINGIEAIGEDQADPCITGDYNCDGKVDAADYTVWRDSLGLSGPGLPADGNGDGTVDAADLAVWNANFGAMAMAPATSIPEPTAGLLALLAATGFAVRRRG